MSWHAKDLIGFDLETTGTNPREARIVTAAITETRAGRPKTTHEWLANPGIPIPPETVAIHGITTARATAEGRPPAEVADEVATELVRHWRQGTPVVAYNASFDLTLLAAELSRHNLPSLAARMGPGNEPGPVIDPLTIDRAVDRYRKGKRTLEAVCVEYGVVLDSAHDAASDALAAVQVAHALAERHTKVSGATVWDLHRWQVTWYADWAAGYRHWLRSQGRTGDDIDIRWPLREPVPGH
ncbi:DNA polymerase III PolC-type [Streptomyces sp. RB5]|uniref:DNA polymerase III PolC-type n=1 Tax=Streptomyces smaragdinus TaxID=2585196 RepID=A0A7K0CSB6_9ACTN|nr:3'-5' exonuclease [Streptomyces smaragdinus]MQY16253.1 DNA polymerase III PolC-type [Streptomyces smaragdinus]